MEDTKAETSGFKITVTCSCGLKVEAAVFGDAGHFLEWDCPACGLRRDLNV